LGGSERLLGTCPEGSFGTGENTISQPKIRPREEGKAWKFNKIQNELVTIGVFG